MNTIITGDGSGGGGETELIKEGGDSTFVADVLEASQSAPVIAVFYSPRSQQCAEVNETLEAEVRAAGGAVRMVKVNIDTDSQVAQQLQIQGVPAVLAFNDGRPVDGFAGPQGPNAIKQFVAQLTGGQGGAAGGEGAAIDQAKALLAHGETEAALNAFQQILQAEPDKAAAKGGAAQCLIRLNKLAEARELLASLDDKEKQDPEVQAAEAALELAEQAEEAGDVGELEKKVEKKPGDLAARYDLAVALAAHGRQAEAIDQLLEIVRKDKDWQDGKARDQLLKIFEALGPSDPAVIDGRRKLSTILFV